MPWLDLPPWLELPPSCSALLYRLGSLRSSPKLLVGTCGLQLVALLWGLAQHLHRVECAIVVPNSGAVMLECETCHRTSATLRSVVLHLGGGCVIACGLVAVRWRDQRLLYVYGTAMLFFSLIIGLTALLTALETPVLEVAVSSISELEDDQCLRLAEEMLASARDHTSLASLSCVVDTAGAVLAIRSKELFSYEEIASQHAEATAAQPL